MQENNEDYFTFSEIITGLKDELVQSRKMLKNLKELTKVETTNDVGYCYWLYGNGVDFGSHKYDYSPHLKLYVRKKPTSLPVIYRSIRYRNGDPNLLIDRASYKLIKEDDNFNFEIIDKLNLGDFIFHPNISITNYDEFEKIYNNIETSKVFNLPRLVICINPYQTLSIITTNIILNNYDEKRNQCSEINFNSIDNRLYIDFKGSIHPDLKIYDLLQTKIPKNILSEGYVELLNQNEDKSKDLYLESNFLGREGCYTIEDNILKLSKNKK